MNKTKTAVSTVGFIFAATLLSKALGLLREVFLANAYGTGGVTSAFVAASQIPTNFFDMLLGSAVSSAFIPVFVSILKSDGKDKAERFASLFFNVVIAITLVAAAIGALGAGGIAQVMVHGFSSENKDLTVHLMQIMFPVMTFIAAAFTVVGVLQSYGSFKVPAAMSVVSSVICIVYLLTLNRQFGITGLAVALLIGWAMQFFVLLPSLHQSEFRYHFSFNLADSGLKQVMTIALPILFATWVQPINVLVNTSVGSGLENGQAVAAINYANRLYLIVASVFAVSVTNYAFPEMSRLSEKTEEWLNVVTNSAKAVAAFTLPITAIFLVLAQPIIALVYQRNAFDANSVRLTSTALFFYSIGMLGFALQEVLNKAYFSKQDSKTPMVISISSMILNVILSFTLSKVMGIGGLALAASVSATFGAALSLTLLHKRQAKNQQWQAKNLKEQLLFAVKIGIMTVVAGLVCHMVKSLVSPAFDGTFWGRAVLIALSAGVALAVYAAGAILLKLWVFKPQKTA